MMIILTRMHLALGRSVPLAARRLLADGERGLKSGLWVERALVMAAPAALCAQEA